MVNRQAILFVILLLFNPVALAKLNASVDRSVLNINESLTLEIVQSEEIKGSPDLSVLEKDFTIVSQSQAQHYSIINGKSERKRIWTINLLAKRTGELEIPPIRVNHETTAAIPLVVQQADNPSLQGNDDVFITVSINPRDRVYVQQHINLKIQVYYRVRLSNLSLNPFQIDDALIEQAGKDKQYNTTINGQNYLVIERNYHLFPQKSGRLEIPAIRLEALQTQSSRFGLGGFFSQSGKPLYRQSQPLQVEVMDKPDSFKGKPWIVSEQLQLESDHGDLNNIRVGDSITITDTIIARGVSGSMIPAIKWPVLKNMKNYPDKPQIRSENKNQHLYGIRTEKMLLIPLKPGTYHIPKRAYQWFNSKTQKIQTSYFPQIDFRVQPADNDHTSANPSGQVHPVIDQALNLPVVEVENDSAPGCTNDTQEQPANTPSIWSRDGWFIAWLVSSMLWVLTLVMCLSGRKFTFNRNKARPRDKNSGDSKKLLARLKQACEQNDARLSMKRLLQWASYHYQQEMTMAQLEDRFSTTTPLLEALKQLQAYLYQPQKPDSEKVWQGRVLYHELEKMLQQQTGATTSEPLKLNP